MRLSFNLAQMLREALAGFSFARNGFYVDIATTQRALKVPAKIRGTHGVVIFGVRKGEIITRAPNLDLWLNGELIYSAELDIDNGSEFINRPLPKEMTAIALAFNVQWQQA